MRAGGGPGGEMGCRGAGSARRKDGSGFFDSQKDGSGFFDRLDNSNFCCYNYTQYIANKGIGKERTWILVI